MLLLVLPIFDRALADGETGLTRKVVDSNLRAEARDFQSGANPMICLCLRCERGNYKPGSAEARQRSATTLCRELATKGR